MRCLVDKAKLPARLRGEWLSYSTTTVSIVGRTQTNCAVTNGQNGTGIANTLK